MARAVWSGVVTFGLVTVPVQLFTATESHTVHFRQLERGTGDRIRNRRVNERTGESVVSEDIVKGYDVGDGDYVVVDPGELDEVAPGRSKAIEISGFVDLDAVAPVYFDRTYYVGPKGEQHHKVYELLRAALAKEAKMGIATFLMRGKEYLVALRAQEDALVLHTLHWQDEVRDPERELPELPDHRLAKGQELRTAERLIEEMTVPWRPEEYEDTYAAKVQQLVEAKRKGEEIVSEEEPPEATNVVDLTAALERSVKEARSSSRASTSGGRRSRGQRQQSRPRARSRQEELADLTKRELYERASSRGVPGRSTMTREQLVGALAGDDTGGRAAS